MFVAPTYVEIVDIDRSIPATANNRRMKQFISFESKHGFVHQTRLLMIGYRWIINIQFWGSQVEWLICKQLWSQADIDARRSKVCELQFFVRIPHKISIEIPDFGLTFNHEIAWFLRYADRGSSIIAKNGLRCRILWWFSFSTQLSGALLKHGILALFALRPSHFEYFVRVEVHRSDWCNKHFQKYAENSWNNNPSLPTTFSFTMMVRQQ